MTRSQERRFLRTVALGVGEERAARTAGLRYAEVAHRKATNLRFALAYAAAWDDGTRREWAVFEDEYRKQGRA